MMSSFACTSAKVFMPEFLCAMQTLVSAVGLPSQVNLSASKRPPSAPVSGAKGASRAIMPMVVPSLGATL
jgi:hypothetical protein